MRGKFTLTIATVFLYLAALGQSLQAAEGGYNLSRYFKQGPLGVDPGQPDTVFTTVDAPLVIPNGGGDIVIKVWGKTDNTGAGNDIASYALPLVVNSSSPSAQVYLNDTTVAFTFGGTAANAWPLKSINVDSNHFNMGAITFSGGFTAGTHLLANVKLRVTGPTTITIDTLYYPFNPEFVFVTGFAQEYRPMWKQGSYPVACPTCPANQPPVLAPIGNKSVNEGDLLSFKISATDPDANPITLSIINKPTGAVFVDSGNGAGSFVWTPTFNQANVYNVTIKASDGLVSDSEIVQITVNNVNRPPVLATIGNKSVNEGQLLSFRISATDPDGSFPILAVVNKPTNAVFVDSGNGACSLVWTPNFNEAGVFTPTFIASDGNKADSELIQITVNNVNRPPVLAAIGAKAVNEGQTLSFQVTAADPDGTPVTLTVPNPPANAVFVDSGGGKGGFVFTPDFNQAGAYPVNFIASDGSLADTEMVQITVNNVNRAPVIAAIGAKSVDEGQSLAFEITATDPDGGTPALTAVGTPTNSNFFDSGDGTGGFVFNPDFTQADVYNVTFIASDGSLSDTEVVAITVSNINRPPVLDPIGPKTVQEGNTLSIRAFASDPDGAIPSLNVVNPPANATFADSGNGAGGFVFNPDNTQAGVYPVTFIASDGALTDSETVTITVTETANQPPVLTPIGPKSVDEGKTLSFRVSATDPDGSTPSLMMVSQLSLAAGILAEPVFVDSGNGAGSFTFSPDFSQAGVYNFIFIASDGSLADSEQVQVTVNNVNRPPELAAIGSKSVNEGQSLSIEVTATDADGTTPSLTAMGAPPNSSFADSGDGTGGFVFNPDFNQAGVYPVTFIASDGILADTEIVEITVNNVNRAPVLDPIGPKSVQEENTLMFRVFASDPDGTIPVLNSGTLPANAVFVDSGNGAGGFVFNPDNTQAGVYPVTFYAFDSFLDTVLVDSEVVTITVTEQENNPPVLAPIGPKSVDEGQTLSFKVSATDPDGSTPTLTAVGTPPNANFVDSGDGSGGFVFSPDFTQVGVYPVIFIASDGNLGDTEVVEITVNNVNRYPVLDPIGPKTVQEENTLMFRIFASDPDGNVPELNVEGLPDNATFADSGNGAGGFVFTPDNTQAGTYPVTFIASDGELADTEVVTITVTEAANQPPVLGPIGPKSVGEGQTLAFKVSATDPDGTLPSLTAVGTPSNANFVDSGNGSGGFVFSPDFTQAGVYPVTFIASDGNLADTEIVQITVNNVNRPPVLAAIGAKNVAEGDTLAFIVSAADPDGTAPSLSAGGVPTNGSFIDLGNGAGNFFFAPETTQAGGYPVLFIASDGSLADSELVQITVTQTGGEDQPPSLLVTLDQTSCWPPNHKMVPVNASLLVNDDRDPNPQVVLYSVTSDEPDDANGNGDGNTFNDIQDASIGSYDLGLSLRCERAGNGDGRTYTICYKATDNAGNFTIACATFEVPHDQGGTGSPSLTGNMPNPFNASTSIYFNLDQQSEVKLGIYNVTGRLVREYNLTAGSGHHSIVWDGTDARGNQVASGIYFYRLRAGIVNQTRKMVLLR